MLRKSYKHGAQDTFKSSVGEGSRKKLKTLGSSLGTKEKPKDHTEHMLERLVFGAEEELIDNLLHDKVATRISVSRYF